MSDLLLFLTGAILSFLGGLYTARRYASRSQVSYFLDSRYVLRPLGEAIPLEIEIFHERNRISNLIETKVGVWNSGTLAFSNSDVSRADPLRLSFSGARVLRVVGPKSGRTSVNADAPMTQGGDIGISFDIFDAQDAFVFVVYSAIDDEQAISLDELGEFEGALKGLPHGPLRVRKIDQSAKMSWKSYLFPSVMALFALLLIVRAAIAFTPYETFFAADPIDVSGWKGTAQALFAMVFGSLFFFGAASWIVDLVRTWARKPPKFILDELVAGAG